MNGCHSTLVPDRCKYENVAHSKGNVSWPYIFTRACQYDNKLNDKGCNGCSEKEKLDKWII